jgi:LmbE family N-acetylglucosaminyl deacetylase
VRTLTLAEPPARVLLLGAHADDIEIGCGATVLRLVEQHPGLELHWVVMSAERDRAAEATASAAAFSAGATHELQIGGFRDGFLPYDSPAAVKDLVESHKSFQPDVVFAPARDDLHQDHRLLSHLAWNTFRDHLVLEYEIPKFDGDLGHPNVFVPVDDARARRKLQLLTEHFPSQHGRSWFNDELFLSLMRLRGLECQQQYAEAFHGRKVVLT